MKFWDISQKEVGFEGVWAKNGQHSQLGLTDLNVEGDE